MGDVAETWLRRAISHGTVSWDRALIQLAALALQSATSAHVGDILLSHYCDDEYLSWGDVGISLPAGAPPSMHPSSIHHRATVHEGEQVRMSINLISTIQHATRSRPNDYRSVLSRQSKLPSQITAHSGRFGQVDGAVQEIG